MKKLAWFNVLIVLLTWFNFHVWEGMVTHYYHQTLVLGHAGAPAIIPVAMITALINLGFITYYVASHWPEELLATQQELCICDSCNVLYNEPKERCLECGAGVSPLDEHISRPINTRGKRFKRLSGDDFTEV